MHSATKYLNGHSDVLAGAVLTARRDPFWERIRSWRRNAGATLGPFEAWLLQRGMRTLFLRVHRASDSALAIATHFRGHPAVADVLYPGLPSHPGHEIAARQMHGGFGGMLSIRLVGGSSHALAVMPAVQVFKRATSLGGVESLIEHRRSMEGPSSPVPGDLLRLSIGIEAPADLIADLESRAPGRARSPQRPRRAGGGLAGGRSMDLAGMVGDVLERGMFSAVIARGGGLRVVAVEDGVAVLVVTGSPGAVLPLASRIETLIRAAVPEIIGVRLTGPDGATRPGNAAGSLAERAGSVLDAEINPVSPRTGVTWSLPRWSRAGSASGSKAAARAAAWQK